jgi:Protein of unknown function (DUF3109)
MIRIGGAVVSLDILEKKFACDVNLCKGVCCVHGDSGAPLEPEETRWLERDLEKIIPFLREEGVKAIRQQGPHRIDSDGDQVTPLVDNKECAYVVFENNIARCGIEKAFSAGHTSFHKPVSCHLYPVRLKKYDDFTALNYDCWEICSPARTKGEQENMPVYRFVKSALQRRFGKKWYRQLEAVVKQLVKQEKL